MEGPDVFGGVMWVFTLGEPPDDLMEGFGRLTEDGTCDWVIWRIMNSRAEHFVDDTTVSAGWRG